MKTWAVKRANRSLAIWVVVVLTAPIAGAEAPLDLLIRGGKIVDGTGAPWYVADVGIADGKIHRIGKIDPEQAEKIIDASGMIVAPGFIDMMGQTASPMIDDPKTAMNLLTQGITTINAGEGASAAPLSDEDGSRQGWTTMAEYFALLDMQGMPVNVVQTVGHTQIRRIVIGDADRRPSEEELQRMRQLVADAMQAGAIGVSTALIYPPAVYAQTEEIEALAEEAGRYGGRYYTHMRNEGDQLLEAIEEALQIGREAKAPVHIFHLKAAGRQNWGKMPQAIARIQAARSEGLQVTADVYPYVHNGLGIAALIHPRHFADGSDRLMGRLDDEDLRAEIRKEMESTEGWENWFRHVGHDWDRIIIGDTSDLRYKDLVGQSVAAIAKSKQEDPWDVFFHLVRSGAFALPHSMSEANKILAIQQPFVSFCTDVGPAGKDASTSHPRAYGSLPRLLTRYVRDLGVISLERAVAQASAAAANNVMVYDRGRVAEGLAADIVIFDYDSLAERATFETPDAVSTGVQHVIVNGRLVLHDGEFTGLRPGRVLRGPGYNPETAAHKVATGTCDPAMAGFDAAVQTFMKKHRIPGMSVAVTDQSRLVFARGYGYADLATGERVQPASLFRIASISKPITAVAILQLVEQGKLQLDDKIFDILDYDSEIQALGDAFDSRLRDVTISHLLQHRGGWDHGQSFDAMFRSVRIAHQLGIPAPADAEHVIRSMLNQQLDFDPGGRYAYSNFGYCLLGRVIETLTGKTYEQHVKECVLEPMEIRAMRIGKTRLNGRAEAEVRYYHPGSGRSVFQDDLEQPVPSPYGGWYLEAMDAHGGWIASAVDLARFAVALDDPNRCPILSEDSIEAMFACPADAAGDAENGQPDSTYYSFGWSNRAIGEGKLNRWHTGSLPGTAAVLIRRHDGKNLVALLNTRVSPATENLGSAVDSMLHRAAAKVQEWPQVDEFGRFSPSTGAADR